MLSSRQTRKAMQLMVFLGLCLAIYYIVVYMPISNRANDLDAPLTEVWNKLAAIRLSNSDTHRIHLDEIENNLLRTQESLERLRSVGDSLSKSLVLEPAIIGKMDEPFQFVDFQIEQQFRIEELAHAADEQKVTIHPAVFNRFPEYTADQIQPNLLWPQLTFLDHLLHTAVRCKVAQIQNLELPPILLHQLGKTNETFLVEFPIRIEAIGSMESIGQLLASLPLRSDETKALKLPEAPGTKPALFVHRFILKKISAEKPDEMSLDLRASGFVYQD